MKIHEQVSLAYDDVLLEPRYTDIESRFNGEASLRTQLLSDLTLEVPIISANMDTVTEVTMAEEMWDLGCIGIIHRFMNPENHLKQLSELSLSYKIGCIGIGVGGKKRLEVIGDEIDAILIDIAHGHCREMVDQIRWCKEHYPDLKIIAGNVATGDGARELFHAGADCVKVGVGPGSLCTTRIQTGCGVPQLTAVIETGRVAKSLHKTIIADGGIRDSGDIMKALAAGANAVMVGSLLAGSPETPGSVFSPDGERYKIYRGMASRAAQESWKGTATSVEGELKTVRLKPSVREIIEETKNHLLSGMTYQNARKLDELRKNAVFRRQTMAGLRESLPHGM